MNPRIPYVLLVSAVLHSAVAGLSRADGPKDNIPENVRQIPPPGIELPADERRQLENSLNQMDINLTAARQIAREDASKQAKIESLVPDVEIFYRAVSQAIGFRELYSKRDIDNAKRVGAEGVRRSSQLPGAVGPWRKQKGLVVRGFRSKIDQTVQPYGLVVPPSYEFSGKQKYRLDLWFHGRGERTGETQFIAQRMQQIGQYAPKDTFVLHPYGRYSNAFKFAGEIDVLEALEHVKRNYRIDENRISVRGFSMGGAGCWQMAVHYPDLFFASNPGAGFSETPEFLKFFQKEELHPTWYEEKLWRLYDCNGYAANLFHLPTVAYSGEKDIQKQAADIMEDALAREGIRLRHVIGPDTGHRIHPESKKTIEAALDSLAVRGRQRFPQELRFVTHTLRYDRMHWLTVTGLGQHWEPATITASYDEDAGTVTISAKNVTALELAFPAGFSPFPLAKPVQVTINEQDIQCERPASDQSWRCELHRDGNKWKHGPAPEGGLRKRHGLQGPIDDAFMSSFIVVRPTGKARHEEIGQWTKSEMNHCIAHWRQQFRGDAVVKEDSAIAEDDIASSNLILFGDPDSNSVLGRIAKDLPVNWTAEAVVVGGRTYDASHHAPVLIYPNPLNPNRYVVLNSGFTYREYAYLNNARQVPKLPDWAIVDIRTPADSLWPGKIADASFFDESWKVVTVDSK